MKPRLPWGLFAFLLLAALPVFPAVDRFFTETLGVPVEKQMTTIFVFCILALGLNVVVGFSGLLQLGIAAFFAIGAFTTGILTVSAYPFRIGFWGALLVAPAVAALAGVILAAPTLRLRGDYLAIVTLGFGEVVRVTILNLDEITNGPRGLNPIPPPWLPPFMADGAGLETASGLCGFRPEYTMYYVALGLLAGLVLLIRVLEQSRLGRALMAIREDELAAGCMGIDAVRTKLTAFAIGAALAGLAGVLYATKLTTTAEPNTYDFNYSIMVLCCVIIGGIGSTPGVLVGALVLLGFDNILTPLITRQIQNWSGGTVGANVLATPSNWRWIVFGLALIFMMRFRPEGIIPSARLKAELHHEQDDAEVTRTGVE